jgi:hypothetical protein
LKTLVGRGEGGLGLEDGLAEFYFAADGVVEEASEGCLQQAYGFLNSKGGETYFR